MPPLKKTTLLLFTRYPEPGKSKTRLVPMLGEQGAADLHKKLTEQTARHVRDFCTANNCRAELHCSGADTPTMQDWLDGFASYHRQAGDNLGERMRHALEDCLGRGAERILLLGSDCPGATPGLFAQALQLLQKHDVVFGPTLDGGYFLVGMTGACPGPVRKRLFDGISWGDSTVLRDSLRQADSAGIRVALTPGFPDIDLPDDLVYLRHYPCPE